MQGPMQHAVDVDADVATLFRAVTTQVGLSSFWTSDCDAHPTVGTVSRFGFPNAPVDLHMRVDELETDRSVGWSCLGDFPHWAGTTVTWEISPAPSGSGSTVSFVHAGWHDDYPAMEYSRVSYTWARIVGALKDYAETGVPKPFLG